MSKTAYVYILASKKNGTLYTGVTTDLQRRVYEHKKHLVEGFTRKYNVTRLVWFRQGRRYYGSHQRRKEDQESWQEMESCVDRKDQPWLGGSRG